MPKLIFIDLFAGAGGVTTGIEAAYIGTYKCARVVACVNHDPQAIASHKANHPNSFHFTEDISKLDLTALTEIVNKARIQFPDAIICLWASLECTNFSKAKGGMPRNADSRTLAEHLYRYVEAINPDIIWIENVPEFQCWGPLCDAGKPISKKNGIDYIKWVNHIAAYGYKWDRKELNCADYGAYTSRVRLFMQFAKPHIPIVWPQATHAKKIENTSLFANKLQPWKPVKEVLNFEDEGSSIFEKKKALCEKTLERIYAGLIKFIAKGDESFLLKYNSVNQKTGKYVPPSLNEPCPTITVQNRLGFVKACFIQKHFSGKPMGKVTPISAPTGTLTAACNQSLVQCDFLIKYHGISTPKSIEAPASTLTTKDRLAKVNVSQHFIYRDFSNAGFAQSVENPAGTILNVPKLNLITCKPFILNTNFNNNAASIDKPMPTLTASRKFFYLLNPQYQSKGSTVENPCFTLIARMDKQPPYLVSAESGYKSWHIFPTDSPAMQKIKHFMQHYCIVDIKMRMLRIDELKLIQGFDVDYYLAGNQNTQKKFIGNSVPPPMVKALIEASTKAQYKNYSLTQEKNTL